MGEEKYNRRTWTIMKNFILILIAAMYIGNTSAQTTNDSCYVYTQLKYNPASLQKHLRVQLRTGEKGTYEPIKDKDGRLCIFESLMDAINFLMLDGWELFYAQGFKDHRNQLEDPTIENIIIRKMMSKEDAKSYARYKVKE